jgi:hypothetical protein
MKTLDWSVETLGRECYSTELCIHLLKPEWLAKTWLILKAWFHERFFLAKCEIFRLFLLNCEQSTQVEIIYSSGRNSKETGEIIRISPRKSARGIRPFFSAKCELFRLFLLNCDYSKNYFYLIAHNSKETGEIIRISPRKSARGIRP